jgi:hypothetical protein
MKQPAESFEVKIDNMIDLLCEGDFTEEGKVRVAELRESWAKARELIIAQELRELTLPRRGVRHHDDDSADVTLSR